MYEHSGRSPALSILVASGEGILAAVFLSFIYNFLTITIPIVYVNFLITFGFAVALGYTAKFLTYMTKIRNHKETLFVTGVIGFCGFYFQWIAFLVFLDTGEHSFELFQNNLSLFYRPDIVIQNIMIINEQGLWEVFGVLLTDLPLWGIWIAEAAMIIGIPLLMVMKNKTVPFSENMNKWYKKYKLDFFFAHVSMQNKFKEDIKTDVIRTITELGHGMPGRYASFSIYYLEGENTQYLSVDNVFVEDRGQGKHRHTPVIHLMPIDNNTTEVLRQNFKPKKEFFMYYI